jgi:DNA-binding MarR family transcriptional regulator
MTHASARSLFSTTCFGKQGVSCDRYVYVSDPAPLDRNEDLCWRGLVRLMIRLPRCLGEDLERTAGITETEFSAVTQLSEASHRRLSMSHLAERTALSATRITRVVDLMRRRDLITREPGVGDGRMLFVTLTPEGLLSRERAEPKHLQNIRRTLFDMTGQEVKSVDAMRGQLAEAIDPSGPSTGGTPAGEALRSSAPQSPTRRRAHDARDRSTTSSLPPSPQRTRPLDHVFPTAEPARLDTHDE